MEKFYGRWEGFSGFFLKNPSKLKNFWVKWRGQIPPSGYAPDGDELLSYWMNIQKVCENSSH